MGEDSPGLGSCGGWRIWAWAKLLKATSMHLGESLVRGSHLASRPLQPLEGPSASFPG